MNPLNPLDSAASIADSVATGLDQLFTSDEERLQARATMESLLQKPHIIQAMTNLEEAKNPNMFVSGWRPALGWLCIILLAYSWIGRDLIVIGLDMLQSDQIIEVAQLQQPAEAATATARQIDQLLETTADRDALTAQLAEARDRLAQAGSAFSEAQDVALRSDAQVPLGEQLPKLDSGAIISLVLALLGLGATRTYEKVNGVARTQWRDNKARQPAGKSAPAEEVEKAPPTDDFSKQELDRAFNTRPANGFEAFNVD